MKDFTGFSRDLSKVALALLVVFAPMLYFNTIVDPYGIFFNVYKDLNYEPNSHYLKIKYLLDNPSKFDSFIFGSSRINYINPQKIPNAKYFNMTYASGLPNAHYEDIQILANNGVKIRNLLVGIDFMSLLENPEIEENDLLRKKYPVTFLQKLQFYKSYLFNMPELDFMKLARHGSIIDRSLVSECGITKIPKLDQAIAKDPLWHISQPSMLMPISYVAPNLDIENNIRQIKNIVDFAKANDINLRLFINPAQTATYLNLNFENYFHAFKRLAEITDFYDFSGLNSVVIDNMNFYEASHYRSNVGDLIIAKIFNTSDTVNVPEDFGRYVNKENIQNNIRFHLSLLKDYVDAISPDCSYKPPVDLSNLEQQTGNPVFSIEIVNEANIMSISKPILVSTPWVEMKGWAEPLKKANKKGQVFVKIGNKIFEVDHRNEMADVDLKSQNKINRSGAWEIMIPTSLIDVGLQPVIGIILSANGTRYSASDTCFIINVLRTKEPTLLNKLKHDTIPVRYSIDLINEIPSGEFTTITDESVLKVVGWSIDEFNKKPTGGVIVNLDGKPFISQFLIDRTDIAAHFNNPDLRYAGWGISIPVSGLTEGNHELIFEFLNSNRTRYFSPDCKFPFKKLSFEMFDGLNKLSKSNYKTDYAIDLMNGNEVGKMKIPIKISDKMIRISGWAVDQPAHAAASDVVIEIDGKQYLAIYGISRPDVASVLNNQSFKDSGWKFEIPTKIVGIGVHRLTLNIVSNDRTSYFNIDKNISFIIP
jgi:hypothetical protein